MMRTNFERIGLPESKFMLDSHYCTPGHVQCRFLRCEMPCLWLKSLSLSTYTFQPVPSSVDIKDHVSKFMIRIVPPWGEQFVNCRPFLFLIVITATALHQSAMLLFISYNLCISIQFSFTWNSFFIH